MVGVRVVTGEDWAVLRDARLAALREAPHAFGSTYAREAVSTEDQWRGRISARSVTFFGYAGAGTGTGVDTGAGTAPSGLAGLLIEDGMAELVSMWVRPDARGRGVGEALVAAVADLAEARGHAVLSLWVTESNGPARRLYERCGFTPTGGRQPLPSEPALAEIRMRRPLLAGPRGS